MLLVSINYSGFATTTIWRMINKEMLEEILFSLPDVVKESTYKKVSYRTFKNIFTTHYTIDNLLMVLVPPASQASFITDNLLHVRPFDGKYGEAGWTIFDLEKVSLTMINEAILLAYEYARPVRSNAYLEKANLKNEKEGFKQETSNKRIAKKIGVEPNQIEKKLVKAAEEPSFANHIVSSDIILYVSDIKVSTAFYEKLLRRKPIKLLLGKTYFWLTYIIKLGLVANKNADKFVANTMPKPSTGVGIPRCELYLYVKDVAAEFQHAVEIGAKIISPVSLMDWGHLVCYIADPDGHVIALAQEIVVND